MSPSQSYLSQSYENEQFLVQNSHSGMTRLKIVRSTRKMYKKVEPKINCSKQLQHPLLQLSIVGSSFM